jgi:DNA-directed RNA polymerase specialized sigma24 family protein
VHSPIVSNLDQFNQTACQNLDEAFTLAWYLTGDEDAAAETVQTALMQSYAARDQEHNLRVSIFQKVMQYSLKTYQNHRGKQKQTHPQTVPLLMSLPFQERCAALLVDVLKMNYQEAAHVMECSPKMVGRYLLQARLYPNQLEN